MELNSPSVLCLGKTVLITENLRSLRSVTSLNALLLLLALGWMKRPPFGFQESSIRPYIIKNMSDLPCQNKLRYIRRLWSGDSVTYEWKRLFAWKSLENQRKLEGKKHQSEVVDNDLSGCTVVFMYKEPEFSRVALILPLSNFWALPGAYFFQRVTE